jgi:hypothetical protein
VVTPGLGQRVVIARAEPYCCNLADMRQSRRAIEGW